MLFQEPCAQDLLVKPPVLSTSFSVGLNLPSVCYDDALSCFLLKNTTSDYSSNHHRVAFIKISLVELSKNSGIPPSWYDTITLHRGRVFSICFSVQSLSVKYGSVLIFADSLSVSQIFSIIVQCSSHHGEGSLLLRNFFSRFHVFYNKITGFTSICILIVTSIIKCFSSLHFKSLRI